MSFADIEKPKNKSDKTSSLFLKGVGVLGLTATIIVVLAVVTIVGTFINGLVLQYIWNTIFPHVFGDAVPVLTVWQAAGVSLVVTYITARNNSELVTKDDMGVKSTLADKLTRLIVNLVITPLIYILLASFIAARIITGG